MSSRKFENREPVDQMIGRALKSWVAHYPPPDSTRRELLEEAARIHQASVLGRFLRVIARGVVLNLRGLSAAFAGGQVFEPALHDGPPHSSDLTYWNFNLMHLSIMNANAPRLGLFSLFL